MEKKKVKTLILKKSKWVCGNPSYNKVKENCLGAGDARLLNKEGFMCCLGQFSPQIKRGVTRKMLYNKTTPRDLRMAVGKLTEKSASSWLPYQDTTLTDEATIINDDRFTTVKEKITALKNLFKKHGYKIIVTK